MKSVKWFTGFRRPLRSARSITSLSVVVAVAIVAAAGLMIWHNRESALEDHRRAMDSMGVVLAEQTGRYAQVIDLILQQVQTQMVAAEVTDPQDFQRKLGTPEIQLYLAEHVRNVPQADAIVLIDANGLMANWSRDSPVMHLNTADRDYFSYLKTHDDPNLFIGSLAKGR